MNSLVIGKNLSFYHFQPNVCTFIISKFVKKWKTIDHACNPHVVCAKKIKRALPLLQIFFRNLILHHQLHLYTEPVKCRYVKYALKWYRAKISKMLLSTKTLFLYISLEFEIFSIFIIPQEKCNEWAFQEIFFGSR